jgi:ComF family protein
LERCFECTRTAAPAHDSVHARVDYVHPWSALVQRLKFRQSPATAGLMAQLMSEDPKSDALMATADLIAPVPLSLRGLLERGYNQSWELVRHLRRRHPSPPLALPDLLTRPEGGPAIHTLPRAQRLQASQSLFAVHPKHLPALQGDNVLLVDDVLTTGATAQAASLALREAGARSVQVWVFARTPPPSDESAAME